MFSSREQASSVLSVVLWCSGSCYEAMEHWHRLSMFSAHMLIGALACSTGASVGARDPHSSQDSPGSAS